MATNFVSDSMAAVLIQAARNSTVEAHELLNRLHRADADGLFDEMAGWPIHLQSSRFREEYLP